MVLIRNKFYPAAQSLRRHFDKCFADPLQAKAERFQWDYWHVPDQYTLLRTPAYRYFPKTEYERFHRFLVGWGRENLGCHDISPPWLSCYINGCEQHIHRDVPHGPLAFVFSLTPPGKKEFTGGETFLLRNSVEDPLALERCDLVDRVAPEFNRLLVFNPSIPHGVTPVAGTHDPRWGRLVIHGWFVNPRPFWEGPLTASDVRAAVEEQLPEALVDLQLGQGLWSLRIAVSRIGAIDRIKSLADTRLFSPSAHGQIQRSNKMFLKRLKALRFPQRSAGSQLTLPLIFS